MKAHEFFAEVARRVRCDQARAEALTTVVLQELRDRLTPGEAADVAAQLPRELKRIWQDGERPDRPVPHVHAFEFIGRVRNRAALPDEEEAERAVRAVFRSLQLALGSPTGQEGEAWDIYSQLPKDLKKLWVASAQDG